MTHAHMMYIDILSEIEGGGRVVVRTRERERKKNVSCMTLI